MLIAWLMLAGCGASPMERAPIGLGPVERSASLVRLVPADWGTTNDRAPERVAPAMDVIELGGEAGGTAYFVFDLPGGEVVHAELVLPAHPSWAGPTTGAGVVLHRTLPFRSRALTRRTAPAAIGAPVSELAIAAGAPRLVRIELTETVRYVVRLRDRRLFLAVRARNPRSPLRLGSPHAIEPDLRPRLDVLRR